MPVAGCVDGTVLVVDASGNAADWPAVRDYVVNRVRSDDLSDSGRMRVGVVSFASSAQVVCAMTMSQQVLEDCVQGLRFVGGPRNLDAGATPLPQFVSAAPSYSHPPSSCWQHGGACTSSKGRWASGGRLSVRWEKPLACFRAGAGGGCLVAVWLGFPWTLKAVVA